MTELTIRPRYGQVQRRDGTVIPIVFHPHPERPDLFVGVHAGDGSAVPFGVGDTMTVDVLGAGQSAALATEKRRVSGDRPIDEAEV